MNDAAELAALVRSVAKSLVIVADNSLGDEGSEVVGVVPADALNGNGDVGGGDSVVADSDIGADEIGLLLGQEVGGGLGALGGEASKVLVSHLDELLVGNTTSSDKNHAVGSVVVLDVVGKLGPGDVTDVLAGAEDGAAEGLLLVSGGVQVIENNFLQLLLNLLRLTENDITFPLNSRLLKLRVLENVLEDIDALRNVLVQGPGEVDGVLALHSVISFDEGIRNRIDGNKPRYRR